MSEKELLIDFYISVILKNREVVREIRRRLSVEIDIEKVTEYRRDIEKLTSDANELEAVLRQLQSEPNF